MRSSPSENQHPLISLNRSDAMLNLIIGYMQNNMAESITVNDLVRYSGSNRTTIYDVFKENLGVGPVSYTHLDVYKRQAFSAESRFITVLLFIL